MQGGLMGWIRSFKRLWYKTPWPCWPFFWAAIPYMWDWDTFQGLLSACLFCLHQVHVNSISVYANYIGPSVMTDANCEGFPICDDRITENDRCVQSLTKVLVTWWSFRPAQYKLLPVRIFFWWTELFWQFHIPYIGNFSRGFNFPWVRDFPEIAKIDTGKNKPSYTSALRVLEIAKIGLSGNLTHLPSCIFAKISRHEKFPIYGN